MKEHATEIINHEEKEMLPLTEEEKNCFGSKIFVKYAEEKLLIKMMVKIIIKFEVTAIA